MKTTTAAPLSNRGRAVLRAIAAGRCQISAIDSGALVVDGLHLSDQFTAPQLAAAGLIAAQPGPARLTASGRALLAAV